MWKWEVWRGYLISFWTQLIVVVHNKWMLGTALAASWGLTSYITDNRRYIVVVVLCIGFDWICAVVLAFKAGTFKLAKSGKIIVKVAVYSFIMLLIHQVVKIEDTTGFFGEMLKMLEAVGFWFIILGEGGSAIKKANEIYPNKLSQFLIALIDNFEKKAWEKAGLEKKQI
jgi:hypothetical protein